MASARDLKEALGRWTRTLRASAAELNALDARMGDGDLGTTLDKCAALVDEALPAMPEDFAGIFKACASACAKASGSSFGTLLAVAFLTAAKQVGAVDTLDATAMGRLIHAATTALAARGGAALGDKTMLDSMDAIARALDGATPGAALRPLAIDAAATAVATFTARPNRIGRARMFGDKSAGLEDPGMVAILRMAQGL
jgi:dihydroxyacetone kinase-like protein